MGYDPDADRNSRRTATMATFFVGRDAAGPEAEIAGWADLEAVRRERRQLRGSLEARASSAPEPVT
jgi:hypothetical protein